MATSLANRAEEVTRSSAYRAEEGKVISLPGRGSD